MPSKMAPQTKTATDWVLGSAMRGTLTASEMVANARTPSINRRQLLSSRTPIVRKSKRRHEHMAATICVSSPYWLWKPFAK